MSSLISTLDSKDAEGHRDLSVVVGRERAFDFADYLFGREHGGIYREDGKRVPFKTVYKLLHIRIGFGPFGEDDAASRG